MSCNAVVALVDEVFAGAAGTAAAAAVRNFLQAQRVTALSDLQYLELLWLQVRMSGDARLYQRGNHMRMHWHNRCMQWLHASIAGGTSLGWYGT